MLTIEEVRFRLAPTGADEVRTTMYLSLYTLYKRLLDSGVKCEMWIDGSYVTKKPSPDDIDLSVMLHEDEYREASDAAKRLLDDITYSEDRYLGCLDAFVCIFGDKGAEDYELDDPLDWAQLWGKDHSERYLKGFVIVEVCP